MILGKNAVDGLFDEFALIIGGCYDTDEHNGSQPHPIQSVVRIPIIEVSLIDLSMRLFCIYHHPLPTRAADTIQIMKMSQAFQRAGHDVTLFTARAAGFDGDMNALWEQYGIATPFNIEFLTGIKTLRGHDIALKAAWRARQRGAGLVFARGPLGGMWAAQLGIPTVFDAHGPPGTRMGKRYLRRMIAGRGFSRLVVITNPVKQAFLKEYAGLLETRQVFVDPNGIDMEHFADLPSPDVARSQKRLAEKFTVGYTGHMYPGRGIELVLALAARLLDLQFVLVGGTESDIHKWRSQAGEQGLENIVFAGFVPNADLPGYYAACNVLLMPYQRKVAVFGGVGDSSAYMSPMKMFEYMASERLIVSSDLPVLREVLNETNAVLCDPQAVDQWQTAIERARNDPTWASQLAQKARQDVSEHTWQRRAQRILEGMPLHQPGSAPT